MPGQEGPPPPGNKRFVIKQGDTYYLTTGKLLEYNMQDGINSGQMHKVQGVLDMAQAFELERNKPHTFYEAVDFSAVDFGGVNTGSKP